MAEKHGDDDDIKTKYDKEVREKETSHRFVERARNQSKRFISTTFMRRVLTDNGSDLISILTLAPSVFAVRVDGFLDVVDDAVEAPAEVEADSLDAAVADREGLLRLMTGATTVTAEEAEAGVGEVFMEPVNGPLE